MLAEGHILNHRYQVLRVLSDKGGMGVIYQATDLNFNNTVVIKHSRFTEQFLRQQYPAKTLGELRNITAVLRKAFEREAHLVRGLKHHSLPSVIDYFTTSDGHQFFVMDFIPGKDLGELLDGRLQQNQGPFPLDQVLDWADQLLEALDYLHTRFESPIIHRDLKPLNLKLTPDGRIVLLDFGLAKGATSGMSVVSASIHGYTLNYAPLEQIRGKGTSVRSDLYSLAVTLRHLLSGEVPPSAVDRVTETTSGEADPLRPLHDINPQIPAVVSTVLQCAASINPNERYATAAEMREALRRASKPEPVPVTVKLPVQPAEPTIIDPTPLPAESSKSLGNISDQSEPVDVSITTLERYSPSPQIVGRQRKYCVKDFLKTAEIVISPEIQNRTHNPFTMSVAKLFFDNFVSSTFDFDGSAGSIVITDADMAMPDHSWAKGWIYPNKVDEMPEEGKPVEFILFECGGDHQTPIVSVSLEAFDQAKILSTKGRFDRAIDATDSNSFDVAIHEFDACLCSNPEPQLAMFAYFNLSATIWQKFRFNERKLATVPDDEYRWVGVCNILLRRALKIYKNLPQDEQNEAEIIELHQAVKSSLRVTLDGAVYGTQLRSSGTRPALRCLTEIDMPLDT